MKKLITFSLIATVSAGGLYYFYDKERYISSTCRGTLNYYNSEDIENDFSLYADIVFTFHQDKTGILFISGDAIYHNERYVVNKREDFNYFHIDRSNYSIVIEKVESLFDDNISPKVINKFLPSLVSGKSRYITLDMINKNTMLISTRYAPILTCVIDE